MNSSYKCYNSFITSISQFNRKVVSDSVILTTSIETILNDYIQNNPVSETLVCALSTETKDELISYTKDIFRRNIAIGYQNMIQDYANDYAKNYSIDYDMMIKPFKFLLNNMTNKSFEQWKFNLEMYHIDEQNEVNEWDQVSFRNAFVRNIYCKMLKIHSCADKSICNRFSNDIKFEINNYVRRLNLTIKDDLRVLSERWTIFTKRFMSDITYDSIYCLSIFISRSIYSLITKHRILHHRTL